MATADNSTGPDTVLSASQLLNPLDIIIYRILTDEMEAP